MHAEDGIFQGVGVEEASCAAKEAGRQQIGHLLLTIWKDQMLGTNTRPSLKLVVAPLAVVNKAPEEGHNSSARPFTGIGALNELRGLAGKSPAGAVAAAHVPVSVSKVLPGGSAIGGGACKVGLAAAGWSGLCHSHS